MMTESENIDKIFFDQLPFSKKYGLVFSLCKIFIEGSILTRENLDSIEIKEYNSIVEFINEETSKGFIEELLMYMMRQVLNINKLRNPENE